MPKAKQKLLSTSVGKKVENSVAVDAKLFVFSMHVKRQIEEWFQCLWFNKPCGRIWENLVPKTSDVFFEKKYWVVFATFWIEFLSVFSYFAGYPVICFLSLNFFLKNKRLLKTLSYSLSLSLCRRPERCCGLPDRHAEGLQQLQQLPAEEKNSTEQLNTCTHPHPSSSSSSSHVGVRWCLLACCFLWTSPTGYCVFLFFAVWPRHPSGICSFNENPLLALFFFLTSAAVGWAAGITGIFFQTALNHY